MKYKNLFVIAFLLLSITAVNFVNNVPRSVVINPPVLVNPLSPPVLKSSILCTMEVRLCPDGTGMYRDASCVWHAEMCKINNISNVSISSAAFDPSINTYDGTRLLRAKGIDLDKIVSVNIDGKYGCEWSSGNGMYEVDNGINIIIKGALFAKCFSGVNSVTLNAKFRDVKAVSAVLVQVPASVSANTVEPALNLKHFSYRESLYPGKSLSPGELLSAGETYTVFWDKNNAKTKLLSIRLSLYKAAQSDVPLVSLLESSSNLRTGITIPTNLAAGQYIISAYDENDTLYSKSEAFQVTATTSKNVSISSVSFDPEFGYDGSRVLRIKGNNLMKLRSISIPKTGRECDQQVDKGTDDIIYFIVDRVSFAKCFFSDEVGSDDTIAGIEVDGGSLPYLTVKLPSLTQ